MELQYFGGNCVRLSMKKAALVIDDTLTDLGSKTATKPGDISLFTGAHGSTGVDTKIVIDQPGEYEVSDVSVRGIAARAHMDEEGQTNATIYKIIADDVRIAVLGHVHPDLTGEQLEALSTIDVLIIPAGGNGYTLDPIGALKLIKEIEPKIVIPTHYDDSSLKYPVPQQTLGDILKGFSMEPKETTPKLKVKAGELSDTTQLIILDKQ